MSANIQEIKSQEAPGAPGLLSQALLVDGTLYCSGQLPLDVTTDKLVGNGDVREEARQVLKNLDAVLKSAGASSKHVVRCSIFVKDLKDYDKVNEIYCDYFKGNAVLPTRTCVQVAALPMGVLVEIDCIAKL